MTELQKFRQMIALKRVQEEGDDLTRELVDSLQAERDRLTNEAFELRREVAELRALRKGPLPWWKRGRIYIQRQFAIWFVLYWVVTIYGFYSNLHIEVSTNPWAENDAPPRSALNSELIRPVAKRFGVAPNAIDTRGRSVKLLYVGGPYLELWEEAKEAQATEIAKFVWEMPDRPEGVDSITVQIQKPVHWGQPNGNAEPAQYGYTVNQFLLAKPGTRIRPNWSSAVFANRSRGPVVLSEVLSYHAQKTLIDTTNGKLVRLVFMGEPFTRMSYEEKRAKAAEISQHLWSLKARPDFAQRVTVQFERKRGWIWQDPERSTFSFDKAELDLRIDRKAVFADASEATWKRWP